VSLSAWIGQYAFWLAVVSALCFVLERLFPWRREQQAFRPGFGQDLFWLVFNGHFLALLLAVASARLVAQLNAAFGWAGLPPPNGLRLLQDAPLAAQFAVLLVAKDFCEWCVHNLLHRVPWLWELHKLHHSIEELDFIGNFRFHWGEVVVYRALTYLPLAVLGVDGRVLLWVAVVDTLAGHLNHANLPLSWGPLRYLINSPKMHVWHHDLILRGDHGRNFGIVFSLWDWAFGTAEMPAGQPPKLGFQGIERFPKGLLARLSYPLSRLRGGDSTVS
jgi:sterol desaturase/sphingolipid hydroxylase (fatty acid hydroxylase superfamily)